MKKIGLRRWIVALCLLVAGVGPGTAAGFTIQKAELFRHEDLSYALDATIEYRFSDVAIDALRNGVPLTLIYRLKIQRVRAFWWDPTVFDASWHWILRFHPLARVYQWTSVEAGSTRNFASLNTLLATIGSIRNLPIAATDRLEANTTYHAALSVALDIESLPLPLRPLAYLSPQWHLSSPWFQWSFAN